MPEEKKIIIEIEGERYEVDAEIIVRVHAGLCQMPDCDGQVDILIRESGDTRCPVCKNIQDTCQEIIEEACIKLPRW